MAQKIYDGIDNVARNTIRAYGEVNNIARNLIRGYLGDENGIARQFWGAQGYVIFDEGEFHYVPQGFDFENNFADTSTSIAALSTYYLTEKLLWVHAARAIPMPQWTVNQDKYIDSNYDDYNEQIILNAIYIPIERIYNPSKLRIIGKGNMFFTACRVNVNVMTRDNGYKLICSEDLTVKELDISDSPYIDYIEIYAPETYLAEDYEVLTDIAQPIPYAKNHIYTNDATRVPDPGFEIIKDSGISDVYFVALYREPNGGQTKFFMYSKNPFTATVTDRRWNGGLTPTTTTYTGNLIYNSDGKTIYEVDFEIANFGYHVINAEEYHTNYTGGWSTTRTWQMGLILLYGHSNVLPTPTGVQNPLQLIKRIEVIGGTQNQ